MFLARVLNVPELEMTDDEAKRFTAAYSELRKHFSVPVVDPKWIALGTFMGVTWSLYGPRVAVAVARKRGHAPQGPATVLSLVPKASAVPEASQAPEPDASEWLGPTH